MFISKEDISNNISITDIADDFNIKLESINSGNFAYRCKCPSPDHKNGMERTNSCYINVRDNNFYCFGCAAGTSIVDFYMICKDCNFSEAMSELKQLVDIDNIKRTSQHIKVNNFSTLLEISKLFKKCMANNYNDSKWIISFMKKTDVFIDEIDPYDLKRTRRLLEKIRTIIYDRYGE